MIKSQEIVNGDINCNSNTKLEVLNVEEQKHVNGGGLLLIPIQAFAAGLMVAYFTRNR